MRKRAVFLDIDGTLTEPGSNVPPASALQAIEMARRNGHLIFLCSGRNYDMLKPLLQYEFDGFVASSGGYIVCNEETIFDCPMTEKQRVKIMDVLKGNGIYCTIECKDGTYTDEGFKDFLRENAKENGNSELLRWRMQLEKTLNIRPMSEYGGQPVYKIVIMSPKEESVWQAKKAIAQEFEICIQDNNGQGYVNGEVVNRKFDKGQALERVCSYLNVPVCDSIAFGDSMNDREMIEASGLSVCMENGSEALKKIADEICPSVNDNGIWHAFQKFHLI